MHFLSLPTPPPLVQCCIMHSLFFNTIKNQRCLGERAGEQKQVLTTTSRENFPTFLEEVDYELLELRAIFAPNILKCPKMFRPRLQFLKERKKLFFHLSLELAWEQKWNSTSQLPCNILTQDQFLKTKLKIQINLLLVHVTYHT